MKLETKEDGGFSTVKVDSFMCLEDTVREGVAFAYQQFGEDGILYMIQEQLRMLSVLKRTLGDEAGDVLCGFEDKNAFDQKVSETISAVYSNDGYDGILGLLADIESAPRHEPEHYADDVDELLCEAVSVYGNAGYHHLKFEAHRVFNQLESFKAINPNDIEHDSTTTNRDRIDQSLN